MSEMKTITHSETESMSRHIEEIARAEERPLQGPWSQPGEEPPVEDLMDDPMVRLVMARDGVGRAELETVVARGRTTLRRRMGQSRAGRANTVRQGDRTHAAAFRQLTD